MRSSLSAHMLGECGSRCDYCAAEQAGVEVEDIWADDDRARDDRADERYDRAREDCYR